MATRFSTTFRGLNTDTAPERVPGGTAIVASNVTVTNGLLQKRAGFDQFENDVNGSANGVLNIFVAKFASGAVHVVCKCTDGFLWQREVSPTPAASFSKIVDRWSGHTADEAGSFFMWADRMHYFDTNGGTRWNPDVNSGVPYKAGIGTTVASTVSATTGGQKEGRYHYFAAWRNSVTKEEGLTGIPSASVECRLDGDSAIDVTATAISADYEANQYVGYCTLGNTEYLGKGDTEVWSYVAYRDKFNGDNTWDAKKADAVLDKRNRMSTRWGLPPAADIVAFDGLQAVYFGDTTSLIKFSIPGFPTALPNEVFYSLGSGANTHYLDPEPWPSWIPTGMVGAPTELNVGGGIIALYTDNETWIMTHPQGSSRLFPVLIATGRGCIAHQASASTAAGVHAIGHRSWTVLSSRGLSDISENRFTATLEDIPVGQMSKTRMATYSFKSQVWAAVAKAGEAVVQRILVYSLNDGGLDSNGSPEGALTVFDVAGMVAAESITAMHELSYIGAEPTMLVATDDGRILQYPSLVGDDNVAGTRVHYSAEWRGYIGTDSLPQQKKLENLRVHCGANVGDNVTLTYKARRTGDEEDQILDPKEIALIASNRVQKVTMGLGNINGYLFEVGFKSGSGVKQQWAITDMITDFRRSDVG